MHYPHIIYLILSLGVVIVSSDVDLNDICQNCECKIDAQVFNVDCTRKNLKHIFGDWKVPNNTKVVKISFYGNDIPTLESFPATDADVEIILSHCNIQFLLPKLFAETKNVTFVDLSYNNLTADEVTAEKFQYDESSTEILALEHLDLSYNKIHSLGKNVFAQMSNLKVLNLEGNDFSALDIQTQLAISSIRQLQSLNLANNELTEIIEGAIQAHENLTELNISQNLLDFVPKSLGTIGGSLQVLYLDNNPILEFIDDTFLGLKNIIELSANNLTQLKYVTGNTFASMPKLKKLSLSNNLRLTEIDREAFGINQALEEFYINNNNLYKLDYKLLPWSKLQVFQMNENPFECSCDLYNISTELSKDITRQENGPFCEDLRNNRYLPVFYLKSDICDHKNARNKNVMERHFSAIRATLIILSIVVVTTTLAAGALAFVKYRRYRRETSYPYASQIAYNPISTTTSRN